MSLSSRFANLSKKKNKAPAKTQSKKKNNNKPNRRNKNRGNRRGFSNQATREMPFTSRTGNQNFSNRKMTTKRVTFNENLGNVLGSVEFTSTKYAWNPGQAPTFPWLAREASQWEKYKFVSARVQYVPSVTEFSPNGSGSIYLGFDSDASDGPPTSTVYALDMQPRSFDLPCKNVVMNIPGRIMNSHTDGFYVRKGPKPPNTDIKTYDCGNLFVSTEGQTDNGKIGILTVDYVVDFFIPELENASSVPQNDTVSMYHMGPVEAPNGNPFLAQFTLAYIEGYPFTFDTNGYFVPPPGHWECHVAAQWGSDESTLTGCNVYMERQLVGEMPALYQGASASNFVAQGTEENPSLIEVMSLDGTFILVGDGAIKYRPVFEGVLQDLEKEFVTLYCTIILHPV